MTKTISISKAREDLPTLVDRANRLMEKQIITVNGKPSAVLMSLDEFESLQETLEILADKELMEDIRQAEKEIAEGKTVSFEEILKDLKI